MKKDLPMEAGISDAQFVRRVLIFIGVVALAAALYAISDILLLVFGAILVAVVLRTIARPIRAGTSIGERLALLAAGLGVLIVIGGTGYLFGSQISDQLASLSASLPQAAQRLSQTAPGQSITEMVKGSSIGDLLMNAFSWGTTIFGAAAALVVVIVAGIYIAVSPEVYRDGLMTA
jgi:predicted PurR-regulated permease PerM